LLLLTFCRASVNIQAIQAIKKKKFFFRILLMSIATLGAFSINQYSEGVAVMLFYALGTLSDAALSIITEAQYQSVARYCDQIL
jgi:cation transport ATPase